MCGERVPEEVRMDALRFQTCGRGEPSQDQEGAGASEPAALRVQEELRSVLRVEERPASGQVALEGLRGLPADRHDPLLRSLADAANQARVEVDARLLHPHGFADAQAGAIEELNERTIP